MNLIETKRLLADFTTPQPAAFWKETLGTGAIGWAAFAVGMTSQQPWLTGVAFGVGLGAVMSSLVHATLSAVKLAEAA